MGVVRCALASKFAKSYNRHDKKMYLFTKIHYIVFESIEKVAKKAPTKNWRTCLSLSLHLVLNTKVFGQWGFKETFLVQRLQNQLRILRHFVNKMFLGRICIFCKRWIQSLIKARKKQFVVIFNVNQKTFAFFWDLAHSC